MSPAWLRAEPVVFARDDSLFGYALRNRGLRAGTPPRPGCGAPATPASGGLPCVPVPGRRPGRRPPSLFLPALRGMVPAPACRFCPGRDAISAGDMRPAYRPRGPTPARQDGTAFREAAWAARQRALPGSGPCLVAGCEGRGELLPALCRRHRAAWEAGRLSAERGLHGVAVADRRPGRARRPGPGSPAAAGGGADPLRPARPYPGCRTGPVAPDVAAHPGAFLPGQGRLVAP